MCEEMAVELGTEDPDSAFLVGLLSLLDSMVDVPMADLMRELPLAPRIRAALVSHEGPAGAILKAVLAWERGDMAEFPRCGIAHATAMKGWLHSLTRSTQSLHSLLDANKPHPAGG
jgi:EAL and modified HD-GYP domain-containing signal transduction protein